MIVADPLYNWTNSGDDFDQRGFGHEMFSISTNFPPDAKRNSQQYYLGETRVFQTEHRFNDVTLAIDNVIVYPVALTHSKRNVR